MGAESSVASHKPKLDVANLHQAFKLALSLVIFYWFSLVMNWDVANYGSLAIVLVSLGTTGATLEKGIARVLGTTVGVAIGFLILGLFSHDRWATMLAFACYLAVVSYFMQGSRNSYAWFVTAFVPLVIWADNYPNFQNAFYFGTFRWLQTTTGIVIYTLVDLLLWPRHAGDQLRGLGRTFWTEIEELFLAYRSRLQLDPATHDVSSLRSKAAGTFATATSTLQQALLDTPAIRSKRRQWQEWQSNTNDMCNALELWSESIDDCQTFNLDRVLPRYSNALDVLEKRIHSIRECWDQSFATQRSVASSDSDLLDALDLAIDVDAAKSLSHLQRAALLCFVEQLRRVDAASRALLVSLNAINGQGGESQAKTPTPNSGMVLQPTPWAQQRLWHSMFPVVAFVSAFLFWVLVNPPTGASVPMFAGIVSSVLLRTPMNPLSLLVMLILSVFLAVAPIYWLVMPSLGTGEGLLCLVFVYALIFGYLGASRPVLKLGPMVMFVNMTGISNQQHYSFQGPVDGALMVCFGASFVTLSYLLFSPLRPERALMDWVKRFSAGCSQVLSRFDTSQQSDIAKQRTTRLTILQSMVLPAPAKFKAARQQLVQNRGPSKLADDLERLNDSMQRTANRLQSLELVCDRASSRSPELREVIVPIWNQVQQSIQREQGGWGEPRSDRQFETQQDSLDQVSRVAQQRLDTLQGGPDGDQLSDQAWIDVYTVLGSLRGLMDAMMGTQDAIKLIDWQELSTDRF